MFIFVSDLHLEDSADRPTIDSNRFRNQMNTVIQNATDRGVESITLVLLGDIFELLKSTLWVENNVRPWQECTEKHIRTVKKMFERVVTANQRFFKELRNLCDRGISMRYLVGNHDLLLDKPMGAEARKQLLTELPSLRIDKGIIVDEVHQVVARHGHEWDTTNRYGGLGASVGDAVVIEILVGLPVCVAKKLNGQPLPAFISEIDDVRPQTPRVIEKWIRSGCAQLGAERQEVRKIIESCARDVFRNFMNCLWETGFESVKTLSWPRRSLLKLLAWGTLVCGPLRAARAIRFGGGPGPYRQMALDDLITNNRCRYVVYGHTHKPEQVPLDTGDPATRLYLNTGTWRRVYRRADLRARRASVPKFAVWDEECVVTIYSPQEQTAGCPPYEFYRVDRGIPH